jgi:hypothetical protein
MTLTRRLLQIVMLVWAFGLPAACRNSQPIESYRVTLRNTERYEHRTVGGDEEGAQIVVQPKHSSLSEIRRDRETLWTAVYFYQPAAGYVGSDYAELLLSTGSDGASAPTTFTRVRIHFTIRE